MRRIKYQSKGKQTTLPIKDEKEITRIVQYLLVRRDKAKKAGHMKRYLTYYRNYMLFMCGVNLAFRAEDLLQLRVNDLIEGYVQIKENKTGKSQIFPLNKSFLEDIKKYVEVMGLTPHEYMFPSQRPGVIGAITRQQADRIMWDVKKNCKIRYTFAMHSLRKTFGYMYYKNGGKLLTLQKMYNHDDPSTTLRYIMWDDNDVQKERKTIYIGGNIK